MPRLNDTVHALLGPCGQHVCIDRPTVNPQSTKRGGCYMLRSSPPPGGQNTTVGIQAVYLRLACDATIARGSPAVLIREGWY